jgi:hypothetical protein
MGNQSGGKWSNEWTRPQFYRWLSAGLAGTWLAQLESIDLAVMNHFFQKSPRAKV